MAAPIWLSGRVPNGYWRLRSNRLKYLHWLGDRLGFATRSDWYGLTRQSFSKNAGGGLLATIYKDSPLAALRDLHPNYDWKPWLMASTPQRYWRNKSNRIKYLHWLGKKLGFTKPEDWYGLSGTHFKEYAGGGLLHNIYRGSVLPALRELHPNYDWKPWLMETAPQGFWIDRKNRQEFVIWLGKQLKYRKPEDWYDITSDDFIRHGGMTMLMTWAGNSPTRAVIENLPEGSWQPWRFSRVPRGYWKKLENRKVFMRALGQSLNFKSNDDWRKLSGEQVRAFGGGALLSVFYNNSLTKMLRDTLGIERTPNPRKILTPAPTTTKVRRTRRAGRSPSLATA